jgi:dolichyl-phosphate beta-glucosyltransferase
MTATTLVMPCFNEAARLAEAELEGLVADEPEVGLLLVDDGSTDGTAGRLAALAARRPGRISVRTLPRNLGKAEAVRQGLLQALADRSEIVGYVDADLATPLHEVRRLLGILRARSSAVLLASRVALLGRDIQRQHTRHYLGRVFASAASALLELRVYDTQCGAKLFRASEPLAAALAEPFLSRWIFDVELLGRLLVGRPPAVPPLPASSIVEEPLLVWHDVPGSKLRPAQMAGAALDLLRVGRDLRRRKLEAQRAAGSVSSS